MNLLEFFMLKEIDFDIMGYGNGRGIGKFMVLRGFCLNLDWILKLKMTMIVFDVTYFKIKWIYSIIIFSSLFSLRFQICNNNPTFKNYSKYMNESL